jgi:hypothetical protein
VAQLEGDGGPASPAAMAVALHGRCPGVNGSGFLGPSSMGRRPSLQTSEVVVGPVLSLSLSLSLTRSLSPVVVVAASSGGGGGIWSPWWSASRCHLSPVVVVVAAAADGGGGGSSGGGQGGGGGRRPGICFF